jgi:KUP system potassium uptake protein
MNPSLDTKPSTAALTLGALGVVYGDIGTSPLYAVKECFAPGRGAETTPENVLGVMSLIIWALLLIISIKYLVFVLRADNRGEGGILAMLSLAFPDRRGSPKTRSTLLWTAVGLAGACLLYGDGIITPAISVLGAMEGLQVATPKLRPFVMPLTIILLIGLFVGQRAGTSKVGKIFGPVTLVWFAVLGVLGIRGIIGEPTILNAFYPGYAIQFLMSHQGVGLVVLGAVVLVVTGGEALYADMGHFGRRPIRIAWFTVVLPCLLMNYLGQGALLLARPDLPQEEAFNPFFMLCPGWAIFPLILLATAAAIIASQALITGAYSLTMHAIQLGYMPRMIIEHTSAQTRGQIYMPQVNWALMVACIWLVLEFRSSGKLASAYGVAVTLTMITGTLLFYFAAQRVFHWNRWQAGALCLGLLAIEVPLAVANCIKIPNGGWFPLVVAGLMFTLMSTWKQGRQAVWQRIRGNALPLDRFLEELSGWKQPRVRGTAVYMASNADGTPLALLHNLKHNKVLHERVVFLTILIEEDARVPDAERLSVEAREVGFWRVQARYGFMEEPDIQDILDRCKEQGLEFKHLETTFFLSRETVIPSSKTSLPFWRARLFSILSRNAQSPTAFFRLPANRVVELGMQVEI